MVRASAFFNAEDLGFHLGAWRIMPGLFVSVGLFLTFLGLVSALSTMGQGAEIDSNIMRELLSIASAKFVMSLTGLVCSIIFTILIRWRFSRLEHALRALCAAIEARLTYISLEDLTVRQLRAAQEQVVNLREVGMTMVAELSRPLREDLPLAIKASLNEAMAPIVERVGKMGVDGVGDMVSGLSEKLTDSVATALTQTGEKIAHAGDKLELLAGRLDQSSGNIGTQMETVVSRVAAAVEALQHSLTSSAEATGGVFHEGAEKLLHVMNTTLAGIRDNTGEGARVMAAAAQDMRDAAAAFRQEIEAATSSSTASAQAQLQQTSSQISTAIDGTGKEIAATFARITEEISQQAGHDLLSPLRDIGANLEGLLKQLNEGSIDMRRMVENIKAGADSSRDASISFDDAAKALIEAATPVRTMTERMELSTSRLSESTRHVAESIAGAAHEVSTRSAATLEAARQILAHEAGAIEQALGGVGLMLERLRGQGDRLDDMDEKLGSAFELYVKNVDQAVMGMGEHVKQLLQDLAPALDTMREIVEQAEQFSPQQRP